MNTRHIADWPHIARRSRTIGLAAAAMVALLAPATQTRAADSWLSRAIEVAPSGQAKVNLPTHWQKDTASTLHYRGSTSARTVFDVTISLYNDPAGDGDPSTNTGEDQEVYESIVRHFADSVCEQTNGNHRLGKVRLVHLA